MGKIEFGAGRKEGGREEVVAELNKIQDASRLYVCITYMYMCTHADTLEPVAVRETKDGVLYPLCV